MTPNGPVALPSPAADALRRRLVAVSPALGRATPPPEWGAGELLADLADAAAESGDDRSAWILLAAVAGAYPGPDDVLALRRALALSVPAYRIEAVLTAAAPLAIVPRSDTLDVVAVTGTLVDVDFCARNAHNTGIQRVVRNTVPAWRERGAQFVAWAADGSGYRMLRPEQEELALRWRSGMDSVDIDTSADPLVIPVDATLALVEVPSREHIPQLVAIAAHSGTAVTAIGYDAIPVVSADTVSIEEADRFAHYLTIIKHARAVACISATTAEEFSGFVQSLGGQGYSGPVVSALPLPEVAPASAEPVPTPPTRDRPLVLMVGSIEPRKNQEGLLSAARILWAQGLDFELRFIGGGASWYLRRLGALVRRLTRDGHAVSLATGLRDSEMAAAYRDARVVVFPSLQEGYGLPVAEALATHTPVITTDYGSTAEIAALGGCLLVDPRDDGAIADALRRVLTDAHLHRDLVAQAKARPRSDWAGYARALWSHIGDVGGAR